jgi:hypothetical protein
VARYLSAEWLAALDHAAQASEALRDASKGVHVVIEHVVTDEADGEVAYHVVIHDGSVSFLAGEAPGADIRLRQTRTTAVAIARGELSAQVAFLDGTMTVRGDLAKLIACGEALTGVDGALESVRTGTQF